jgi:uncharacterized protein
MGKKIAIIGSGISGLTCAHLLHQHHDISVFEANDYIGGHTATKDIEVNGTHYSIDTGFIVFNDWTYPNFIKLMEKIGVQSQPTEMSFSVKNTALNLEYNGNTLNSLFAQRRNILRPRFWRIVRDILRFNKICKSETTQNSDFGALTLFEFIQQNELSDDFTYNYILPMCAAIWSTSLNDIKTFPFQFFLKFFNNHGLLNITDRPQWFTIIGGSRSYIAPLIKGFESKIYINSSVQSVSKHTSGYKITVNKVEQYFDEVIFACHSDQALRLLEQPSDLQNAILGSIQYAANEVVLHTDIQVLPKRKLAWASWNYSLTGSKEELAEPAVLSYNMNILQRLTSSTTFCVTLNNTANIEPNKILGKYVYAHPQFDQRAIAAQKQHKAISGQHGLHFCGAYWYNGFHEDGVRSALDVCADFGVAL